MSIGAKMEDKAYRIHEAITSPKAFSLYACIGVVATAVIAVVVTKKQCKKEMENSDELNSSEENSGETKLIPNVSVDNVVEMAKVYAPVILAAAGTIWCINKSNTKWMEYNGLINSALLYSQEKMAKYRSQVPGVVAGSLVSGLGGRKAEEGKQWFCLKDLCPYGDIYFESTEADVYYAEYHLNRNFCLRGSASVREFCAFLGVDNQIEEDADYYGWDTGYFYESGLEPWIDFSHSHTEDPETGETINMITFTWEPMFSEDHTLLAYGYRG